MTLGVSYHEFARGDLIAIWSWYEDQEFGLGDRFVAALDTALDLVSMWPGSGTPTIQVDVEVVERRVHTVGFPYLVRYRTLGDTILVTAIYHERRHPDFGAGR